MTKLFFGYITQSRGVTAEHYSSAERLEELTNNPFIVRITSVFEAEHPDEATKIAESLIYSWLGGGLDHDE